MSNQICKNKAFPDDSCKSCKYSKLIESEPTPTDTRRRIIWDYWGQTYREMMKSRDYGN